MTVTVHSGGSGGDNGRIISGNGRGGWADGGVGRCN